MLARIVRLSFTFLLVTAVATLACANDSGNIKQEKEIEPQANKKQVPANIGKIELLRSEIKASEKELDDIKTQLFEKRKAIFNGPGSNLSEEYDKRLSILKKEVEERARQLGLLNFKGTEEYPSPDVWINAFGLSVSESKKVTSVQAEKDWARQKLKDWHDYVKSYEAKTEDFMRKLKEEQTPLIAKADAIKQKLESMKTKLAALDPESKAPARKQPVAVPAPDPKGGSQK